MVIVTAEKPIQAEAKPKSSALLWVIGIVAVLGIGLVVLLVVFGVLFMLFFGAVSEPGSYSGPSPPSSLSAPVEVDYETYSTASGDPDLPCRFEITGTVTNPNDSAEYDVGLDCFAVQYSDYGAGYAAGLLHGNGYASLGTIAPHSSKDFSISFNAWGTCSDLTAACQV
ncbi:MAG: hypothetical protein JW834_04960 [Candidatus Diapherotrites archaeon]|nr:hypothetical protein [Candidatus Diapherotrites archaeon]